MSITNGCLTPGCEIKSDDVQLTSSITLSGLTRQDKLRIWLLVNRLTFKKLAEFLGVATTNARQLCMAEIAQPHRVERLKALGIPAELLPEPKYTKPGPKHSTSPTTPFAEEVKALWNMERKHQSRSV